MVPCHPRATRACPPGPLVAFVRLQPAACPLPCCANRADQPAKQDVRQRRAARGVARSGVHGRV